jgi:hypothetical protein
MLPFRFTFLPENSTHIMQPLDVSVFAPMKRKWREILGNWKDECTAAGDNYASIPKQVGTVPVPVPTATGGGVKSSLWVCILYINFLHR